MGEETGGRGGVLELGVVLSKTLTTKDSNLLHLIALHSSHPHFPPPPHMKEANHQRHLPYFTSDPADTTITASTPAPPTTPPPQTLNAFPPIRRVPFPSRLTDEGSGGCRTALLVSPRAHRRVGRRGFPSFGNHEEKGFFRDGSCVDIDE